MLLNVVAGVIGAVSVAAHGDHQVGIAGGAKRSPQLLKRKTADLRGAGKVGVVFDGDGNLRELQQIVIRDKSGGVGPEIFPPARDFEVARRSAGSMQRGRW